jgi:hypothetical protein
MDEIKKEEVIICKCPYCEGEIEISSEFSAICKPCNVAIITCESCGGPAREGLEKCPQCGEPLK